MNLVVPVTLGTKIISGHLAVISKRRPLRTRENVLKAVLNMTYRCFNKSLKYLFFTLIMTNGKHGGLHQKYESYGLRPKGRDIYR